MFKRIFSKKNGKAFLILTAISLFGTLSGFIYTLIMNKLNDKKYKN